MVRRFPVPLRLLCQGTLAPSDYVFEMTETFRSLGGAHEMRWGKKGLYTVHLWCGRNQLVCGRRSGRIVRVVHV